MDWQISQGCTLQGRLACLANLAGDCHPEEWNWVCSLFQGSFWILQREHLLIKKQELKHNKPICKMCWGISRAWPSRYTLTQWLRCFSSWHVSWIKSLRLLLLADKDLTFCSISPVGAFCGTPRSMNFFHFSAFFSKQSDFFLGFA